MKTNQSTGINIGRQIRTHMHSGASTRLANRQGMWLGVMAVLLAFGLSSFAQQTEQVVSGYQRSFNVTACGYGLGQCNEGLLSSAEAAQVGAIRHRMNVQACGYGIGECNKALLLPDEAAQVLAIRHRMNVQACGYGIGECREDLLTPSEAAVVRSTRARQENFVMSYPLPSMVETSATVSTSLDTQINALFKALLTSVGAPAAENSSYYGELNKNGIPKTVQVSGYTRSNGTYVQGYYRSAPGTNPRR